MDEVIEMPKTATAVAVQSNPSDLLRLAVEQGKDMETLERLMALQERWEATQARKAYVEAMAAFKLDPPEIFKRKEVAFGDTRYMHATLGDVTTAVINGLAQHGISHRWDTNQTDGRIVVTCILTHKLGHSESTALEAAPDSSGKKNAIQQVASTVTYLQRYTLLAASGLATKDMEDDDGASSEEEHYDAEGNLQDWTDKANAAVNLIALNETRKMAGQDFANALDVEGWNAFKLVVEARRAVLIASADK